MRVGRNVNKQINLLYQIWPKKKASGQDVYSEAGFLRIMVIATNKFEVVWLIGKGSEFLCILKPKSTKKIKFLNPSYKLFLNPGPFAKGNSIAEGCGLLGPVNLTEEGQTLVLAATSYAKYCSNKHLHQQPHCGNYTASIGDGFQSLPQYCRGNYGLSGQAGDSNSPLHTPPNPPAEALKRPCIFSKSWLDRLVTHT